MDDHIRIAQPDMKTSIVVSHASIGDERHPELLKLTVASDASTVTVVLSQELTDLLTNALETFRPDIPMGERVYSDSDALTAKKGPDMNKKSPTTPKTRATEERSRASRKQADVEVFCDQCGTSVGYVVANGHKRWLCETCGDGRFVALPA